MDPNDLEQSFLDRAHTGNRNNELLKFGFALIESGMSLEETEARLLDTNTKLSQPLSDYDIQTVVLPPVRKLAAT